MSKNITMIDKMKSKLLISWIRCSQFGWNSNFSKYVEKNVENHWYTWAFMSFQVTCNRLHVESHIICWSTSQKKCSLRISCFSCTLTPESILSFRGNRLKKQQCQLSPSCTQQTELCMEQENRCRCSSTHWCLVLWDSELVSGGEEVGLNHKHSKMMRWQTCRDKEL